MIARRLQRSKPFRQIAALAAVNGNVFALDVDLRAEAIELDLMNPLIADGRDFRQRQGHGFNEGYGTQHVTEARRLAARDKQWET